VLLRLAERVAWPLTRGEEQQLHAGARRGPRGQAVPQVERSGAGGTPQGLPRRTSRGHGGAAGGGCWGGASGVVAPKGRVNFLSAQS